jgi:pimeloyl-ACP methyl ester carboxylesterase
LRPQRIIPITVIVLTVFFFSITGLLFSIGFQYPVRRASPLQENEYETDFWDLTEAISSPMDIVNISSTVRIAYTSGEPIPLHEWYFSYASEMVAGDVVRINSVILRRNNTSIPSPTILFLHGYGERYSNHIEMLRELASMGVVVMGIDHPGCGDSTGMPDLSINTFLNVTDGPQSSNLYHSVWAAARAITLLESLAYVEQDSIVVSGDSMGAMTTFIISAIDSRVDGVIPMIAAGNLLNSIASGSLINSVIPPSYSIDSEEMHDILSWFDPIAYARILTQPTLMLFGTNDDFFPIISMKDTVEVISAPLTLGIVPNWGHGVYEPWSKMMSKWMSSEFLNNDTLPSIDLSYEAKTTFRGFTISVNAHTTDVTRAWACWRSGEPGSNWLLSEMRLVNDGASQLYIHDIIPSIIGKVSFFVIVEDEDSISITTSVQTSFAGSMLIPILLIISSLSILILIKNGEWRPETDDFIRQSPYMLGMFLLGLGFFLPFITIRGRATLSVLQIIELFGNSFLLNGWFLPSFAMSLCFILALSAYRNRFQFRMAGTLWSPVVIVLIILFLILSGVFGFFGSLILVDLGPGGPVFLVGMILMQVLDKTVRVRMEKRIKEVRDKVRDIGEQVQGVIKKEFGVDNED